MGEHLSSPIRITRQGHESTRFTSDESVGGSEVVGKIVYVNFNNKKLPMMAIFEQTKDCLTTSNLCFGVPLRTYGYSLLTKDRFVV